MNNNSQPSEVSWSFSNGDKTLTDINQINKVLAEVGSKISLIDIPSRTQSILEHSKKNALTPKMSADLLDIFYRDKQELLDLITDAGREPAVKGGGFMSTHEPGVAPYPKVYDMKAMSFDEHLATEHKFGKLHVNAADNNTGPDEVMMLISGGPWAWFFMLPNKVILKVLIEKIPDEGPGWQLCYNGINPHAALMNPEYGLVVAYATRPEVWTLYQSDLDINGSELLGTNSWIDFSSKRPVLLNK